MSIKHCLVNVGPTKQGKSISPLHIERRNFTIVYGKKKVECFNNTYIVVNICYGMWLILRVKGASARALGISSFVRGTK